MQNVISAEDLRNTFKLALASNLGGGGFRGKHFEKQRRWCDRTQQALEDTAGTNTVGVYHLYTLLIANMLY